MNTDTNSHWDKLCILGLIVILALAVVLVASSTASINDGGENVSATAIGDYDYNLGGQTATLIGYSSEGSHPADIVIPDAVEYPAGSGTTYKVTVIGLGAFANDSSVNSITIGNNVEYIDDRVCAQCTNLKGTLIIPNSVVNIDSDAFAYTALTELVIGEKASYIKTSAFSHCNNLTKITYNTTNIAEYPLFYHLGAETGLEVIFGDNVTNIPNQMLSSNTKLKTLTIGTGVKSMGAQAFAMCTNLTKVNYNATDITSFFASAFEQSGADGLEVIFGDNVEIIPANIFSGNKKLSSLTIGTNVNGIGNIAFAECSNLTSITYNATNANVYESAFNGAGGKGLEVTFGDEVTNIPERIFQECRNMATLTIGKNVANIGNYAFTSCMGVTSISYNAINATLGKEPFANIGKESENLVVTFGDEVTNIPAKIFQGCSNLTTLTIGESVVDIGEDAFTGCKLVTLNFNGKNIGKGLFSKQTELKTLCLGDNVETIGEEAFLNCEKMTTLTIGEGATSIDSSAFNGCSSLTTIVFKAAVVPENLFGEINSITELTLGDKVTTIGASAFKNAKIETLVIPESVTKIEQEAFANCVHLTSIEFNAAEITDFGGEVFANAGAEAESLEVVFGDKVTVIPEGIFRENTKIAKLTIGENVNTIGGEAFAECTGIKTIEFYAPTIPMELFANSTGLEKLVIGEKVTIIRDAAFAGCIHLTSIDFNAVSVTEFGGEVFVNAGAKSDSLEVVFGDEVTVIPEGIFAENSNITKITLGSALTTIEARAFAECSGINAITIPESVTKIEEGAFANCVNLTSIEFNAVSVTEFGGGVFDGAGAEAKSLEVVFGNNVTVIPREMFTGNSKITKLIIGEKVEMIGEVAFAGCTGIKTIEFYAPTIPGELFASSTGLENLVIGKKVTIIGNAAFAGCIHLTSIEFNAVSVTAFGSGVFDGAGAEAKSLEVVFGNNVTVIPREMFTGNSKITKLIIGEKVETIGEVAFAECSGLTTINFNAINIKDDKIGNDVFSGAGSDEGLVVVFGEKVTHIPRAIFAGNEKMTELTIGENVTSIGDEAFRGCSKLATIQYNATQISTGENAFSETGAEGLEIIFGDNVTKICDNAFMNCTGLTSITISNSITTIGNCAFMNCTNLSSVNFGSGVESIGDEAFRNCAIISLVIPANVKNINTMSFYDNSALNDVTITEGTLTFGNLAFGQCPNIKNAVFGTFGDNVSVGENVFSYGTESDVVTQYIFKNVGISDDFIFTEETVKKGIFNDRVYEFKQQGILVNHAVITFDPKEGSCPVESLNTDETGKITETLPVATRDGYIFIGWYDGETKISQDTVFTKNTTVEAKWNAQYTITFDANGGECSVKTMKTNAEGKIDGTIPTPTRERYTFEGWYLNGEKISEETVFTKDTTVKAEWKYIPYVITFDPKGGECIVKTMYTKEDGKIDGTIPTPTREGFLFEGWYDGEIQISKDTVFTKDTTVEAKWSSNACTVTFDPDNGEDVFTITTEKGKKIEEPTVSRKGYTFIGWFDSNDTLWIFDNDVFNEDTSLKAKWMEIKAEIETTTDSNGNAEVVIPAGTDVETVEIVDENMTITITGETAKKIVGNRLIISIRPINAEFAYELIMKLNDEDFYGEITVSIPFDSELTEEPTVYIRENGKDTLIESVFDTENNTIYFEANHGSIYVVKYTEEPDPEPVPVPAKGDDFNWLLLVLFLATVLSVTFVGAARKD